MPVLAVYHSIPLGCCIKPAIDIHKYMYQGGDRYCNVHKSLCIAVHCTTVYQEAVRYNLLKKECMYQGGDRPYKVHVLCLRFPL